MGKKNHKLQWVTGLSGLQRGILGVTLLVSAFCYWKWAPEFYPSRLKTRPKTGEHPNPLTLNARAAPEFELKDSIGQKKKLSDFKGNLIVLHFWASWCPPCLGELPQWLEFANSFKGRSIQWIALSQDQNWEDALRVFPRNLLAKNLISLLDSSGKTSDLYGTYQFPETYLISPDLKIVMKLVGPQDWGGVAIRSLIERILKET